MISFKKCFVIIMLLQLSSLVLAQKKEIEKQALGLLKQYNLPGYNLVTETINIPSKYQFGSYRIMISSSRHFARYIRGKDTPKIISSLGTVVHEMAHGYSHNIVYKMMQDRGLEPENKVQYIAIPINDEETILVRETETFPSRELVSEIPEELRTHRFNTYIKTKNFILSTQQSGIYGLLGEFMAYYHGCQTDYDMYQYYTRNPIPANQDYLDYMSEFNGSYYAHLEFKFYILTYLIYAQSNYPQIYKDIITNEDFTNAFLKIDRMYAKLIENSFDRNEEIAAQLKERGISVRFDDEFNWVDDTGVGNFLNEYNLLKKELEKSKYVSLMKLLKEQQ